MSVIYIALPVAFLLVLAAFLAFRWCIQTGQLDDLDNASNRMLHDDLIIKTANRQCIESEQAQKHQ